MQGLAFVGAEVLSFNALVTTGLQAEWVAAVLQASRFMPDMLHSHISTTVLKPSRNS